MFSITTSAQNFTRYSLIWVIFITLVSGLGITIITARAMINRDLQLYSGLVSTYLNEKLSAQIFTEQHDPEHPLLSNLYNQLSSLTHVELIKFIAPSGDILWSNVTEVIGKNILNNSSMHVDLDSGVQYSFVNIRQSPITSNNRPTMRWFPWAFEVYIPIHLNSHDVIGLVGVCHYPRYVLQHLAIGLIIVFGALLLSAAIYILQINRVFTKTSQQMLELQQSLEQNKQLSTVGKYVSVIVHDTRNLLSSIRFMVNRLLSQKISNDQKKQLVSIERPLSMSYSMMNDLLNFSTGIKPPLDYERTILASILEEAKTMLCPMVESAGHQLIISVSNDTFIDCNSKNLIHILINLVKNSTQAMPQPGVICIKAERLREGTQLSVLDSGKGIPIELESNLFEPFVSEQDKYRPGLGLAIVRDLVERHNGSIKARNCDSGGAEFILYFPDHDSTIEDEDCRSAANAPLEM